MADEHKDCLGASTCQVTANKVFTENCFKKGDVVMYCGLYGEVVKEYDPREHLDFDCNEDIKNLFHVTVKFDGLDGVDEDLEFETFSGKLDIEYWLKFPHLPKLEHAQRPDTYPRTIQVRQSVRGMLRLNDKDIFDEFIENFTTAKQASEEGDYETTRQFFNIYC